MCVVEAEVKREPGSVVAAGGEPGWQTVPGEQSMAVWEAGAVQEEEWQDQYSEQSSEQYSTEYQGGEEETGNDFLK